MRDVILHPDVTELVITPHASSEPRLAHFDQIMVRDNKITIEMDLKAGGRTMVTYRIRMEANNCMGGFEDSVREQLMSQKWLEMDMHCPRDERPDWNNVHVRVEDPLGILTWLFPGGDFSNLVKTLQQHGDQQISQPLRLPASDQE